VTATVFFLIKPKSHPFFTKFMFMKFEIYQPSAQLRPFVKHFVISESDDAQTYKVLPGTSLVMGFQYSGKLAYLDADRETPLSAAGVTGLMDAFRVFKNTAHTGTVLVVFRETGAPHFFRNPVNELFRQSLSLEYFFLADELNAVSEQLSMAETDRQKIEIIEKLLIRHLQDSPADLMVNKALQYIYQSKGTIRIADLANKLNTSQSPLEKRFRRVVGASPKKFASIVRVKSVLSALAESKDKFVLYDAGYYDQAHLIKDFKTFTSLTPEQYLKEIKQAENTK
jgi:AraC-like DNA-binding protein